MGIGLRPFDGHRISLHAWSQRVSKSFTAIGIKIFSLKKPGLTQKRDSYLSLDRPFVIFEPTCCNQTDECLSRGREYEKRADCQMEWISEKLW